MATKDEILNAIEIVDGFAGRPSVGFVRETLDDLAKSVEEVAVTPITVVDSTKTTDEVVTSEEVSASTPLDAEPAAS